MNNEEIRAACAKAASLANSVEDDGLRATAFGSILNLLLSGPHSGGVVEKKPVSDTSVPQERATRAPSKRVGLTARLEELAQNSFFGEPRVVGEIAAQLKIAGWNHETKEISARLIELVRAKKLRRAESTANGKKVLRYSNW